jgi:hypothetical protein
VISGITPGRIERVIYSSEKYPESIIGFENISSELRFFQTANYRPAILISPPPGVRWEPSGPSQASEERRRVTNSVLERGGYSTILGCNKF